MAKAKKDSTQTDATPAGDAKPKKASAKKAEAPPAAAAEKPTAAKAAAGGAKKPAAAAAKGAKPTGTPISQPLIDTNLAASAAAAMVANRNVLGGAGGSAAGGPAKEPSSFRQLKESLAKPGAHNLGGILGTGPVQQKKTQTHGPDRQVGRNQTFGADVNRASVPRRTGGG